MMSEPDDATVERVARAIHMSSENLFGDAAFDPGNDAHWAYWWVEDRKYYEDAARAAIAAMPPADDGWRAVAEAAAKVAARVIQERAAIYSHKRDTAVDFSLDESDYAITVEALEIVEQEVTAAIRAFPAPPEAS